VLDCARSAHESVEPNLRCGISDSDAAEVFRSRKKAQSNRTYGKAITFSCKLSFSGTFYIQNVKGQVLLLQTTLNLQFLSAQKQQKPR
jgi:hypothetical protein